MRYMIATDTGGTFTDVAVYDCEKREVAYGKTLTNYTNLIDGVLEGMSFTEARLDEAMLFKHGTTHVINTYIERTGAKAALVATRGFSDMLEIGRGNRPVPFALGYRREAPLIPRTRRFEVSERLDAAGKVLLELNLDELRELAETFRRDGIEAVAVSFVNAYVNPVHEKKAVALLRELLPDVYVTSGTFLTREWFEFERTSTAAANAYVGARMSSYISTFDQRLRDSGFSGRFFMMGSNGGVLSKDRAMEQPIALVESGPIGGCIGAAAYAKALNIPNLIAFDMGGTTAKCALIQDGVFDVQPVYYVGGYEYGFPLKTPVLDIVEVGAGGGSIASVDDTGRLSVGPRSAGSEPGPVAYGRGGKEPTVTDANLVLGRIDVGSFMQGKLRLDREAAGSAIRYRVAAPLGYAGDAGIDMAAQGILELAVATMASAIKEITIERGHDVREFALMSFGGGGPLFASTLARELGIPQVIIPPHPGNFSTIGMLLAGARIDLSRMVVGEAKDDLLARVTEAFDVLDREARDTMKSELDIHEVDFERVLDMRYRGQKHTVRVPFNLGARLEEVVQSFEDLYRKRYGHTNANSPVEIIGVRLGVEARVPSPDFNSLYAAPSSIDTKPAWREIYYPAPHGRITVPVWQRRSLPVGFSLEGPAVIEEFSSTTVLHVGDRAVIGELGQIIIKFQAE